MPDNSTLLSERTSGETVKRQLTKEVKKSLQHYNIQHDAPL